MSTNDVEKLAKMIHGIRFAMMTTIDVEDGSLRSRPMTLQNTEFNGDLWFFCSRRTGPVLDIESDARINLAFSKPEDSSYVSVVGIGEVINDKNKAQELWNPAVKAWFPLGLEDPDLRLIRVQVESADYWDSPSSTVVQLYGFAKAILTGEKSDKELGHHGHVDMRQ